MMRKAFSTILTLGLAAALISCQPARLRSSAPAKNMEPPPPAANLTQVAMRMSRQVISVGETATAELIGQYDDGSSAKIQTGIQWTSSATDIVTIDENGTLTAAAMGTSNITGAFNGQTAQTAVVVIAMGESLVAILIAPDNGQVEAGKTLSFTAKGVFGAGSQHDVTQSVTWSSGDTNLFTIDSLGVVTGVSAGVTNLKAELSGVVGLTSVTVIPPKQLEQITLATDNASVYLNETVQLTATARYNDQSTRDVSAEVVWTSGTPEVATVDSAGKVTGVTAGQAVITATMESQTANITVTASDGPTVTRVVVDPTSLNMSIGNTQQLTATADLSDGSRVNVTSMATWMSSAPNIVSVSNSGMAEASAAGQATITVGYRGQVAMINATASDCAYPQAGTSIRNNSVFPELSWNNAHDENGNQINFSMRDFHCSAAYSQYTSIHFLITAGWCPYCPDYLRSVNGQAAQIEAAGGKLVYVEVETSSRQPASNADAVSHIDGIIGTGPGYRIGDGDTMPTAMSFGRAVQAFPSMFVVRKSDMVVVSDSTGQSHVSLAQQIAGGGGGGMPTTPNCGAADEETYEPNDDQNAPAALMAGANFTGGICTPDNQDWYLINQMGSWTLDLTFTHATGDLDMYVWPMGNIDLQNPGGMSESYDDNEQITFTGPGVVVVTGFQGSTAPYEITLQ